MKILNSKQLREADAFTIAHEPVKSIDLMERAARACAEDITSKWDKKNCFFIFCGTGNNGGDGLAIARLLYEKGYSINVFVLDFSKNASGDFLENQDRLKQCGINIIKLSENGLPAFSSDSVVIDAIFGTGLSRSVEGEYARIIQFVNKEAGKGVPVVSIDVPSGLFDEDNSSNFHNNIIRANYTLTFQAPKLSFLFPENFIFTGEWKILDIDLNAGYISGLDSPYYYTELIDAALLHKKRNKFSHKGTYGHALIIAGSYGKTGAAVLAARACLRSGAGLVTTHVPKSGYAIMQSTVPEAMLSVDQDEKIITESVKPGIYSAIGVGPGIGIEKDTQNVVKMLIQDITSPIVIDADGLNILSGNKTWLSFLKPGSILTPHPKEFERLAGKASNSYERLILLKEFSAKYNVVVILKGAFTAIAFPNKKVYFNSTGNPGMATGGTGDVLTGIITGLLAQGYDTFEAAILGAFVHGLSGDLAVLETGEDAMTASDIINFLSKAFLTVAQKKRSAESGSF